MQFECMTTKQNNKGGSNLGTLACHPYQAMDF